MNKYQEFSDLLVWQKAHQFTLEIYRITKEFPSSENFRLVNQLCRSSSSIPTNIAEGFGRSSKKDFAHFLSIAKGSTKESFYHLILSKDLGYINERMFIDLVDKCNEISKMLSGLIKSINKNSKLSTQNSKLI